MTTQPRLDNTLNRLVHEKILILDKSQAYFVYTVMLTSTKLKYFMDLRHLRHDKIALLNNTRRHSEHD